MRKKVAFVVFYQKQNIFSFNALVAAIETERKLNDIEIYFIRGKENLYNDIEEISDIHESTVLGISFFTTQLWEVRDLVKSLRKKYGTKVLFIAGGPHPTGDPEGTLKMDFDLVVRGEGEETLIEILINVKNNKSLNEIKGIAYLDKDGKIILTKKREWLDLNKYPALPSRHIKYGAIEITRGCPYVCYFCQTPYILGTAPRHRSIKSICDAVKIMKEYEKTDIRFITPNAFSYGSQDGKTLNLPELELLLINIEKIIAPKGRIYFGSFPSEVRPEHVTDETLGLVLKYAANDNIVIGAQSGSQKILNSCNRGHTIDDVYNAVKLTVKSGLIANVDFIFNLPNETDEDINLTIDFMKELSILGAKIHTHSFMPLPQTVFANETVKQINEKTKKLISDLTSKGLAYGDWKKQEKLAENIANYFKSKKLRN
ncbi:MAG: TIGR04013 family B12-binding domain/radical SAM domain-containing protein [Candidatus Lokiarchaeota archaeon]|nr:TIGR04013 family B12-binding domain/radical SAM domain-containing protein [Candidatus Lokiarchaeota archaeon]